MHDTKCAQAPGWLQAHCLPASDPAPYARTLLQVCLLRFIVTPIPSAGWACMFNVRSTGAPATARPAVRQQPITMLRNAGNLLPAAIVSYITYPPTITCPRSSLTPLPHRSPRGLVEVAKRLLPNYSETCSPGRPACSCTLNLQPAPAHAVRLGARMWTCEGGRAAQGGAGKQLGNRKLAGSRLQHAMV
jgi:hypothetical protein